MSNHRISTLELREVVRRLLCGDSIRQVSRELALSRNTVRKYRQWAKSHGLLAEEVLPSAEELEALREKTQRPQPAAHQSSVEPYRVLVTKLRADGVELVALHRLLQERGFTGSYSAVRRFARRLEQTEPEKFLRLETLAGEEAQVDFGYVGHLRDEQAGRDRKAWAFVMTLSFSRHQYAEIVFDQTIETWIRLHVAAFESFGGVVRRVVVDNLKAAIVRAVLDDPAPQRSYRDLAEHYGFLISPCRPRKPRHKGKVESGVHYLKRNAMAGRRFRNLAQANAHIERWVREIAGQRNHGTTHEAPLVRFEREVGSLKPLPATRYEVSRWAEAKVHPDCHIHFDYNRYSAPHRFVGERLWVRATAQRVELYHSHERVASHARPGGRGHWATNAEHYPPEKVAGLLPEPVRLRAEAQRVGPATGEFIDRLLGDRAMDRARGAASVLRQEKRYGANRLEAACSRALAFDEIRCHTVKMILARDLDLEESEQKLVTLPGPLPRTARFARSASELAAGN